MTRVFVVFVFHKKLVAVRVHQHMTSSGIGKYSDPDRPSPATLKSLVPPPSDVQFQGDLLLPTFSSPNFWHLGCR